MNKAAFETSDCSVPRRARHKDNIQRTTDCDGFELVLASYEQQDLEAFHELSKIDSRDRRTIPSFCSEPNGAIDLFSFSKHLIA